MEKLIITVGLQALDHTTTDALYPHFPSRNRSVRNRGWKAGASILHIHVRDPKTGLGTQDVSIFKEVVDRIRSETDAILCLTTSGIPGRNLEFRERLTPLSFNPELVSFDAGSINMRRMFFSILQNF